MLFISDDAARFLKRLSLMPRVNGVQAYEHRSILTVLNTVNFLILPFYHFTISPRTLQIAHFTLALNSVQRGSILLLTNSSLYSRIERCSTRFCPPIFSPRNRLFNTVYNTVIPSFFGP
jgi:hypothetical protein